PPETRRQAQCCRQDRRPYSHRIPPPAGGARRVRHHRMIGEGAEPGQALGGRDQLSPAWRHVKIMLVKFVTLESTVARVAVAMTPFSPILATPSGRAMYVNGAIFGGVTSALFGSVGVAWAKPSPMIWGVGLSTSTVRMIRSHLFSSISAPSLTVASLLSAPAAAGLPSTEASTSRSELPLLISIRARPLAPGPSLNSATMPAPLALSNCRIRMSAQSVWLPTRLSSSGFSGAWSTMVSQVALLVPADPVKFSAE